MTRGSHVPGTKHQAGVYFVTGADLVKIGFVGPTFTGGMVNRLIAMQSGSPVPLALHRFVAYGHAMGLERLLHGRYAAHRRHGEWFAVVVLGEIDALSDDEIIDLMPHRSRTDSKRTPLLANTTPHR